MATRKTPSKVTVDELVGSAPVAQVEKKPVKRVAVSKKSVEPLEVAVEEKVADSLAEKSVDGLSLASDQAPAAPEVRQEEAPRRIHIGGNDNSYRPQHNNNNNRFNRYPSQGQRQQYGSHERDSVQTGPTETVVGFLDIQPEGHGFLRPKFIPSARDIYISQSQIRRFMLRGGDQVEGLARPPKDSERYYGLLKVEKVNGTIAEDSMKRPHFDDLTPIYPNKQVLLSTGKSPISTRVIDIVAPIGFGQRGMIVSPPKAGKTTILKDIAAGISENFPDVHLMAALIGERPEEVTDISMSVKGEVVASNFDEPPENQTRVAEITLERAKRMVELGKDVIILLDSITRLARAYNLVVDPSGRTLSGGFDPAALWPAKKFFGAARNCQEGGSLTIIGTALVETGSRMDDLIYEEFKGTGNMELHLVRSLAERRIFPAISVERSGTRGEEKILSEESYKKIVTMRRMMDMLDSNERTAILVERLGKVETNDEFLEALGKS
jgi:transcription termination factor Rho